MSIPCFVANWKMNKGIAEAEAFLQTFEKHAAQGFAPSLLDNNLADIIISPPFTALSFVSEFLKRSSLRVDLAAQNVHYEGKGAFTGEIAPSMLRDVGCRYVIIGHSERRQFFGESDAEIHRKLNAIIKWGLKPILCIGETLQERLNGKTWAVLEQQLRQAFGKLLGGPAKAVSLSEWLIAYEPVWAIGTGETPAPGDAGSVLQKIQACLSEGLKGGRPRVLYGGSVNENNIEIFMKEKAIDGVLVGGASLSAEKFLEIIKRGASVKKN